MFLSRPMKTAARSHSYRNCVKGGERLCVLVYGCVFLYTVFRSRKLSSPEK